jgi:hypothetical protein
VAIAGFWYVPGVTPEPKFTVKVIATDPPPGIRKVPQLGTAAPAMGLLVEVCTALPVRFTDPVEA